MARSSAEIRAMVHAANAKVEEGEVLIRQAQERFSEARVSYLGISQKLESAASYLANADRTVGETLASAAMAKDEASSYASII